MTQTSATVLLDHRHIPDPELRLRGVVEINSDHSYKIRPHQHYDYEFICLFAGQYEFQYNGQYGSLQPGQGILLQPGDRHRDFIAQGTNYVAVNFLINNNNHSLLKNLGPQLLTVTDEGEQIRRILRSMCMEHDLDDVFTAHLNNIYLQELYWKILRLLYKEVFSDLPPADNAKQFANKFRRVAMSQIKAFPGLEALSSIFNLSARTLNNNCNKSFGMSPLKALLKIKLDHAYELLTQTSMSIKEISDYLGFQNPYHFSRVFKKAFFHSPATLRKRKKSR